MFEHIILFSSSYRIKRRIGWHYSEDQISKDVLDSVLQKTIEIISEPKYAVHRLVTDSSTWESVVTLDSFFEDIYIFDDLEEFLLEMKKDSKITALDVAKFLLSMKPMSNLKLQKMIYLVYADYLEKTGKKLFREKIVAYKYGPVVPDVYKYYKKNGRNIIKPDDELINQEVSLPMALARFFQSDDEKNIIHSVQEIFEKYGEYAPSELVTLTHKKGTPWSNTEQDEIISDENILKYHYIEK